MTSASEWISWFVQINDPSFSDMWRDNPSYLVANLVTIFMAILSLTFAWRHGFSSRYFYLWIATILHGIVTELVSYNFEEINNFWHSQTFMIFAKRRFPLYIVIFYPATVVHAYVAASRLRLPWWAEPFAVGLFDVLLDFPYDIMGIKMVWWTWHDTDANVFDRMYWVPWTSYIFHMAFHSSLAFLINSTRYLITGSNDKDKSQGFFKEMLCVLVTGALSMGLAVISQFIPIYHPLKDHFGLHSEVIVMIIIGIYVAIVWSADRMPKEDARTQVKSDKIWWQNETGIAVLAHYIFYMILVVVAKPENVVSTGLHEPLGPKHETVLTPTASGVFYTRQRYLDPHSYDENYFDFHCVEEGTPNITANPELIGKDWYTICGVPFENRAEYIVVVWSFCIVGLIAFYNALGRSASYDTVHGRDEVKKAIKTSQQSESTQQEPKTNKSHQRKKNAGKKGHKKSD